ncbi:MAG: serine protein kinase, partial [Planctomycetota bacterium]
MSDDHSGLYDLVRDNQQQASHSELSWSGSFPKYLARVEEAPQLARNAWQRMLDMIESYGRETVDGEPGQRRWCIFNDPFSGGQEAVYGLEEPLNQLVDVIRAGARGLGPERRIILLHGPVGSAKSTIARLLKHGLERYTHSAAGAIYTFSWDIDGEEIPSPMNQDPLLLVPQERRVAVEERLTHKLRAEYAIRIEGDLDPVSRFYYSQLMQRYDGDWERVMEHVRVRQFVFSEVDRVGIGT